MLNKISDRILSLFVPKVEAAAGDTFTQYCGCKWLREWYQYFRTCYWHNQPGGLYTCYPCYTDGAPC